MSCTSAVPNATLSENSFYVGITLQNILYGIQLGTYFKTMQIFQARRRERRKADAFYTVVSSVMHLLITIRVASDGAYGQRMWLIYRDYPGGPLAYEKAHASYAYVEFGEPTVAVLQQMANAFMMYRCRIVWNSHRAMVLPSVLWLASLVLGILVSRAAVTSCTEIFSGITSRLGLAYIAVSVSLNTLLTCVIWYRLACHAREHGRRVHFTVDALVVESALPYTLCGIALVVSYGIGSPTRIAMSCVYTITMCISLQMLTLRVAEGKAWVACEREVG